MNPHILFPAVGLLLFLLGWPLAWKDSMVFGALFTAMALLLPWLGVTGSPYRDTCFTALGAGVLVLLVRGWRTANRMQRERQGLE